MSRRMLLGGALGLLLVALSFALWRGWSGGPAPVKWPLAVASVQEPTRPRAGDVAETARKGEPAPAPPVRGEAAAPVTLEAYLDFECPSCARATPALATLLASHGDEVKIVFRHLPLAFHRDAPRAHRAAMAAREQGRFWEMHDRIFENPGKLDRAQLVAHAEGLGLDLERFRRSLADPAHDETFARDRREAERRGIDAVPTFVVNGEAVVGAQSYPRLVALVETALTGPGDSPEPEVLADPLPAVAAAPPRPPAIEDPGPPIGAAAREEARPLRLPSAETGRGPRGVSSLAAAPEAPPARTPDTAPDVELHPESDAESATESVAAAAAPSPQRIAGYAVQLAARPSRDEAERTWRDLSQTHADLLAPQSYRVTRVDLGARGVLYRLRVGPMDDAGAAKGLCSALRRRGGDCYVVSPPENPTYD